MDKKSRQIVYYRANNQLKTMEIKSKLYIVEGEKHIIGDGKIKLLEAIEKYGSVNKAAKEFGLSYPHAWRYVHEIEEVFNKKIVNTKTGGKRGGGSNLTDCGKKLIFEYNKCRILVDKETEMHFEPFMKFLKDTLGKD